MTTSAEAEARIFLRQALSKEAPKLSQEVVLAAMKIIDGDTREHTEDLLANLRENDHS